MKRIILISIIVIGALALTVTKLLSNADKAKKKIYIHDLEAAVLVETANPVANYTFESAFSYLGVFDAMHQNNVASEGSGKLIDLLVKEGQQVQKGQVIAKLDDELIQLQIENAKLNIAQLKNDNARFANLRKEQAVSSVEAEKMELKPKNFALKELDEYPFELSTVYKERRELVVEHLEDLNFIVQESEAPMFVWAKLPEKFDKDSLKGFEEDVDNDFKDDIFE
ncbi:MAG: biotin/lipoyl-binding protein, partial [Crocinitomicaceae bacterium]